MKIWTINYIEQIPNINCLGYHCQNVPTSLVRRFYFQLNASESVGAAPVVDLHLEK